GPARRELERDGQLDVRHVRRGLVGIFAELLGSELRVLLEELAILLTQVLPVRIGLELFVERVLLLRVPLATPGAALRLGLGSRAAGSLAFAAGESHAALCDKVRLAARGVGNETESNDLPLSECEGPPAWIAHISNRRGRQLLGDLRVQNATLNEELQDFIARREAVAGSIDEGPVITDDTHCTVRTFGFLVRLALYPRGRAAEPRCSHHAPGRVRTTG